MGRFGKLQVTKKNIRVNVNNCAQCLSCMLICSFTHSKAFNPSKSSIRIIPGKLEAGIWTPIEIQFLQTCKPKCWLCAKYCAYGALEHVEGE